jgi:hypothetical protein
MVITLVVRGNKPEYTYRTASCKKNIDLVIRKV